MTEPYRCGFASIVGRPNVGKSTLTNAIVGAPLAIVSPKPQTTRRAVRGVYTTSGGQLIVVDTPGLHRPRTLLGERLNSLVRSTLTEVDVVVFCAAADQPVGPGDRFIAEELRHLRGKPLVAVVTRADLASRETIAARLLQVSDLGDWAEIVPVSAVSGEGVPRLASLLLTHLPEGPALYPEGELTDQPDEVLVAELIREQALADVRDELPHSIAVTVEEIHPRPDSSLVDVSAVLWVERPSQRPIVLGAGGRRLKAIGSAARPRIEALLGSHIYLDLRVKVAKDWQRDPKQLRRVGLA